MELLLGATKVTSMSVHILLYQLFLLTSHLPNCLVSVSWQVQELVLEYAALIDVHFGKLLNFVQRNNWRTNPNVLVGARVAVFRKGATLMPTVVTG